MKKSKKGVTLVELVICCFIIVMLGGACTSLLMSGEHIYSTSADAAGAQLDSDVLQTYMMKLLPLTKGAGLVAESEFESAKSSTSGNYLYFDEANEGKFTLRMNGDNTTIGSISDFYYKVEKAGTSDSARAQFVYKVTMNDDSEFVGGFVMSNVKYVNITQIPEDKVDDEGYVNLKSLPFYFSSVTVDG